MLKELSMSEYITKYTSILHLGAGILYILYGIGLLVLKNFASNLTSMSGLFGSAFLKNMTIGLAIILFIAGIYTLLTAYGLWGYKNFGRIMLLIEMYALAALIAIMLIISIFSIITFWQVGLIYFLAMMYLGLIIFLSIYLFQAHPEMVALFNKM
ncbi:MAG: hypothetical protein WCX82_01365 [archaeon]|jgi:hypothetical protein